MQEDESTINHKSLRNSLPDALGPLIRKCIPHATFSSLIGYV